MHYKTGARVRILSPCHCDLRPGDIARHAMPVDFRDIRDCYHKASRVVHTYQDGSVFALNRYGHGRRLLVIDIVAA